MCIGLPGQIVSIDGSAAVIDCWGSQRSVRIESLQESLLPGDFVIEHDGVIERRVPREEVEDTLLLYELVLPENTSPACRRNDQ